MKKVLAIALLMGMSCVVCAGAVEPMSAADAIKNAQTLNTIKEKADFIMQKAQALYESKQFQQAIQAAQYVLANLDKNSTSAKDLIAKAKAQLQSSAQTAMGGLGTKLFGK